MPKGKADSKVIGILEEAVKGMVEDFKSTPSDFQVDDIVKCSLMTGIYKVYGKSSEGRIIISHIDGNGEIIPITAKYLKKLDINKNILKVLFGRY